MDNLSFTRKQISSLNMWFSLKNVKIKYNLFHQLLNLLNFLNVINHLPFLEMCIIFRDVKMRTWNWSINSTEPGQTARMCRLVSGQTLYWWQRLITFSSSRIWINKNIELWITGYVGDGNIYMYNNWCYLVFTVAVKFL